MNSLMLQETDIREALRVCFDTSGRYKQPVNIVDLGLVEAIKLHEDLEAPGAGIPGTPVRQVLQLTLLTPGDDDARTLLAAQVGNRLAGLEGLSRAEVVFAEIPWGPERMSVQARRTLGLDVAQLPILNNRKR